MDIPVVWLYAVVHPDLITIKVVTFRLEVFWLIESPVQMLFGLVIHPSESSTNGRKIK